MGLCMSGGHMQVTTVHNSLSATMKVGYEGDNFDNIPAFKLELADPQPEYNRRRVEIIERMDGA